VQSSAFYLLYAGLLLAAFFDLKMEVIFSYETSVTLKIEVFLFKIFVIAE
jgi:hypothetical protein